MMQYLYLGGFIVACNMAGFARYDKNYSEMRSLLMIALLFFSLWLEKYIIQIQNVLQ
jgi:hypothetical protein